MLQLIAARVAELRAHPSFDAAMATHTDGILRVRAGLRDATKMIAKEERYRAFTIFLMLAAEARLSGSNAVAYRSFYEACTLDAAISDRTAKTVAALLVHFRFADAAGDRADRRRKSLIPTARAFDYFRDWGMPAYAALALVGRSLQSEDRSREMMATFAAARPAYCAAGLEFFSDDSSFRQIFAAIEGGSLVCMWAISATVNGEPAPSRTDIAERFGLSRAQVSRVIAEGRAAGLFTPDAKVTPSARLLSLYADCEARVLAFIDIHREMVRGQLDGAIGGTIVNAGRAPDARRRAAGEH